MNLATGSRVFFRDHQPGSQSPSSKPSRGGLWRVVLLLAACLTAIPVWPQLSTKPIARQATTARPAMMTFSDLALSPDGRRVAWVSGTDILLEDLTQPASQPKTVAHGAEITWSPDSRQLAFLSVEGADRQQLYLVDATGGAARKLTNLSGSLTTPRWSPDGKTLAVLFVENPPRQPGSTVPIPRPVGQVSDQPFEQRLALIDLVSTELRLVSPADLYIWEYDWSPDSSRFIVNAAVGDGDNNWFFPQIDIIDASSGKLQVLLKPDMQIKYPRWSPDGKQIAFIGGLMAGDLVGNYGDVYVMPVSGGRAINLTPRWRASAYRIGWLSPGQILIREVADGDVGLVTLDMKGVIERLWKGADFSPQGGSLDDISLAKDNKTSVAVLRSLETPPEIWIGAIGAWRQFTHFNAGLHLNPDKVENLHWTSDQWRIQGWLTYPRDYDPHRRYPMVVFVHGGPSGTVTGGCSQAFADAGYFVLCPNFRGSAGFGEDFVRASMRDFGYGDFRDILTGVDQVLKTFPVDKNRIGITGHSYGGYRSMWAVTQTDRFHAAAPSAGISDWLSYVGEADISNWVIPYFGVSIYDDPAVYARTAPMTYVKNVKTPTLLLVGADDGECPATQSLEFWRALKTLGVATQVVIYPNEGHGFIKPEDSRDRTLREIRWFDKYLK